jgi:REP element-mobilizing transposase RayT
MPDHVHILIATTPKYAAFKVAGSIGDKSAIHLAHLYGECPISTIS